MRKFTKINLNGLAICISLFLIPILSSCSSSVLLQQTEKPKNVVLSSFQLNLWRFDGSQYNSGNSASLFVSLRNQNASGANLDQIHMSFNQLQNKLIKKQLDGAYYVIQHNLKNIGITLLPANYVAQKRKESLDSYGFPNSSQSQENAKLANAALNLTLYLDGQNYSVNNIAPGRQIVQYTPKLTLSLTMVDSTGKVIWKDNDIAQSEQMVQIDEMTTGGNNLNVQMEPSFSNLVNNAMQKLIQRLPASIHKI